MTWDSGLPLQKEFDSGEPLQADVAPRLASGFLESVTANWQASATGLWWRGKSPDMFPNSDLPWYERIGGSVAGLVGDAPAMGLGYFAGAALPLPAQARGLAGGAGAFAAPAMVRESLMQYYDTGKVDWSKVAQTGIKEGAIGAATFWTGGLVSKVLPAVSGLAAGLARQSAIGGAELGAMMGARSVLEWRLPEAHEFVDNAVLIFGLRGAREYGIPALMRIYERTGKTPGEVAADAVKNSDFAQEVLQGRVPEQYKPFEIEPRGEIRPEHTVARRAEDPSPLDRATYNLRHIGDEATMRAELMRAGVDHMADIQAARRGRVSRAETLIEANAAAKWLQDTLGEGKVTREVGQGANDAQIVGYAKVLDALFGQTRDAAHALELAKMEGASPRELTQLRADYTRAESQLRAVTADYLGATAEVGRAMRAIQYIKNAVGDVGKLQEVMNKAGGERGVDFRAQMIGEMKSNKQLASFVKHASIFDKVVEWWKASILSGPTSHVINFVSGMTYSAMRIPRTVAAAAISTAMGKETVLYREAVGEAIGLVAGMVEGTRAAGRVFSNAWHAEGFADAGKAEVQKGAFGGTAGKVIRSPFTALEAADAFVKTINGYATRYANAARASKGDFAQLGKPEFWNRELSKEAGESVMARMVADGLRYTFQTELGPSAKRLIAAAYDTPGLKYVMPFALPFVRTPMNIYSEAVRLMPGLGVLSGRMRAEYAKGGEARDRVVADQIIGTALAIATVSMVDAGIITGGGPADPEARRALLERGWQPYSFRIGDTYYSYARIEPFATLIGSVADLWNVKKYVTAGEYELAARALSLAFTYQVTEKTFVAGIATIVDILQPDEQGGRKASQAVADILGGFVPNLATQIDRELDAHVRDARSFVDRLVNRVPLARRGLLPKRDSFGQEIEQDSLFPFSGIKTTHEKGDPVREELAKIGYAPQEIRDQNIDVVPGPLEGEVEISNVQLDSLRTKAGERAYEVLTKLMDSPGYQKAPVEYKRAAVEQVFARARQEARLGTVGVDAIRDAVRAAQEKARSSK